MRVSLSSKHEQVKPGGKIVRWRMWIWWITPDSIEVEALR